MKLTVVGLGCVGTVAAAGLSAAGYDVLGVDLDRQRIALLSSGEVPFYEPGLQARVGTALQEGRLRFLHRDEVSEPLGEAALIATGTPPADGGAADLSQVVVCAGVGQGPRRPRPGGGNEEYGPAGDGSEDTG